MNVPKMDSPSKGENLFRSAERYLTTNMTCLNDTANIYWKVADHQFDVNEKSYRVRIFN